jgi:ubiquinone/menaquinone biosynthesis C-methylase UbiE
VNEDTTAGEPWWRSYFDHDWFRLHEPLFPEELSRREVAGMIELLGVTHGARILDSPCGWGRHTKLLREAGFDAWGADLSYDLLRRFGSSSVGRKSHEPAVRARARARARARPFLASDLRALPFRSSSFDAVMNVFTSLGLFDDDSDDHAALREARRVLKPGGSFLLESMHRDDVVAAYAEEDAWTLPDGTHVEAERHFDPVTGVSHETWRWTRGRRKGEKRHALRLRTATEIASLLKRAGFRRVEWYGGWEGEPFTHRSSSLIAVARTGRARLRDPAARR